MYNAFDMDPRVSLSIDFDLAVRLGEFIVKSGTVDKQIMAFGHRLLSLDESESENHERKWIPRPRHTNSIAKDDFSKDIC